MAKETMNVRDALREHRFEYELLQKIPCTKQENEQYQKLVEDGGVLPEGVYAFVDDSGETSKTEFYTILESDLTESEIREYLTYKQLRLIRTIKNCVMFFTVLTIIGMFVYLLIMMNSF